MVVEVANFFFFKTTLPGPILYDLIISLRSASCLIKGTSYNYIDMQIFLVLSRKPEVPLCIWFTY